jgi:pSer/pThr/pTyr-binding forkhead associated (FHA) protein
MTKCPFCNFDNEDGAAYCERCKSDLSVATPEPVLAQHEAPMEAEAVMAIPMPVASDELPHAEPVPAVPVMAVPEVVAVPAVQHAIPVEPVVIAPIPVEAPPALEPEPIAAAAPPAPPIAAAPAPAPEAVAGKGLGPNAQPRLLVLRGQKRNVEYPLYDGLNFIGRADDKPVDIDLEDQEPPDRVWCSRQHCCISFEANRLEIEDLNSVNGTYVNRQRIYPGQKRELQVSDIIQIGNVQLRVIV